MQWTLAAGLALGCGSSPIPKPDPYTGGPTYGGGSPGTGGGDGGAIDAGDSGIDGGGTPACDGGCLQLGQVCQPDEPNGGCAPGLTCLIDLSTGTTYTCQSNGFDF